MKVTQIWEVEIDGKTLAFKVYRAGGWWVAEPERPGDFGLTAQSESLDHLIDDLEAVLLDALDRERQYLEGIRRNPPHLRLVPTSST